MADTIRTKFVLDGEAEYNRKVKDINQNLKTLNTETKLLASEMKLEGDAIKNNASQRQLLTTQISTQERKLSEQKQMLSKATQEWEKSGQTNEDARKKMEHYTQEVNKTQTAINNLKAKLNALPSTLQLVGQNIQEVGQKMVTSGEKIAEVGSKLSRLSMALGAALIAAIKFGSEFDSQMSSVAAVMNTTTEGMEALRQTAISWGEKTVYTATEAGEALYYMGLAGWDADEAMESLGGVLNLAAAGNLDLGRTSDIVTDAMTALHMAADEYTNGVANAEHFSNVLAATMSNSNTTVDLMGETFKYVAPVAGSLGYNIEDLSLAIGLMANAGIKGSTAGTTLRNILQRMAKPTKDSAQAMADLGISLTDSEGNTLSFLQVLKDLRAGFGDLVEDGSYENFKTAISDLDSELANGTITEDEYSAALDELIATTDKATDAQKLRTAAELAGARGMSGLIAITTASDEEFNELVNTLYGADDAFNGLGYASGMAETQMDNLKGDITKFTSALGTAQIKISDVANNSVRKLVQGLTDLVVKFNNLDPKIQGQIVKWAAIAVATGPAIFAYGKLTAGLGNLVKMIGGAVSAMGTFSSAFSSGSTIAQSLLVAGINPLTLGLKAGALAIGAMIVHHENHKRAIQEEAEALYGLTEEQQQAIDTVSATTDAYTQMKDAMASTGQSITAEYEAIDTMIDKYNSLVNSSGEVEEKDRTRADNILNNLAKAMGVELDYLTSLIDENGKLGTSIDEVIEKKKQEALLTAYYDQYVEALQKENQAQVEYANALAQSEAAQDKLNQATQAYNSFTGDGLGPAQRQDELERLKAAQDEATASQEAANEALRQAESNLQGYSSAISNYENVQEGLASGTMDFNTAVTIMSNNLLTASTASQDSLNNQYNNAVTNWRNIKAAYENGSAGITQQTVNEAYKLVQLSKAELDKAPNQYGNASKNAMNSYERQIVNAEGITKQNAANVAQQLKNNLTVDTTNEGNQSVNGYVNALGSSWNLGRVRSAAATLGTNAKQALAGALSIESPSKVFEQLGKYTAEGFAIGMTDDLGMIRKASQNMAVASVNGAGTTNKSITAPISVSVNVNGNVDNINELAQTVANVINDEIIKRNEVFA